MRLVPLLVLLAAGSSRAHSVPVLPSACALDPIEVTEPATGARAAAAPVDAGAGLLVAYDTRAKTATFQFCPGTAPGAAASCVPSEPAPQALAGDLAGSLRFPPVFVATLFDSGDLVASLPLAVTINGTTIEGPLVLTTGLAAAGDVVAEGAPIDDQGSFTLVATLPAGRLPALTLRVVGRLDPVPDPDQFAATPTTTAVAGTITARTAALRVTFETATAPAFASAPTLVRVRAGGVPVATAVLPAGLAARPGRRFVGRGAGGRTRIAAHLVRRRPVLTYVLTLRLAAPTLPSGAAGRMPVDVTYATGGILGRGRRVLRVHPRDDAAGARR